MAKKIYIDIETYSSVDIKESGVYKYVESIDFEILMCAYAIDEQPVKIIDLAKGESYPEEFLQAFYDPNVEKHAHNAAFERNAFKAVGMEIPASQWYCTAVKAAYCGLPLSLEQVSKALDLGEQGKLSTGKALIRYFCVPVKPTKTNGMRVRNFWHHDLEKWEEFKTYCMYDVIAERAIDNMLEDVEIPSFERNNYIIDQKINDRGIRVDLRFAEKCVDIDNINLAKLTSEMKDLTALENPNSIAQLKKWLLEKTGQEVTSLGKEQLTEMINTTSDTVVKKVLTLRQTASKTSTKKYVSMQNCACYDERVHGLFQFYGANRTGRWAGRLVQLQNLPRNYIEDIENVREYVKFAPEDDIIEKTNDLSETLSQLIRTSFIASEGKTFGVADFSAIEARVLSWLAGEQWRIEIFAGHGKIYEASAAKMFNVPIESVTKESDLRAKGKNAELALGYQGGINALKKMGGESMGLTEVEMGDIVKLWRKANPAIVSFWQDLQEAATRAVLTKKYISLPEYRNLGFFHDGTRLRVVLPSGRILAYHDARAFENRFGSKSIKYMNLDQTTRQWAWTETYGGKLAENIVQAISRDLLAHCLVELDRAGFDVVMHVHDEVVAEIDATQADSQLEEICELMGREVPWAAGLPLRADGYHTPFYKKD